MALYKPISSTLIYKSVPNRERIFTIPTLIFKKGGDITDKDLMEKIKIHDEKYGKSDLEIYLTVAINEDIPEGSEGRIWQYYDMRYKPYHNIVDVRKKFKLTKQLNGEEKAINWFKKHYDEKFLKEVL